MREVESATRTGGVRVSPRREGVRTTCPVERTLDLVGDRWSLMIVRDAFDGIRRFGAFQARLGVARNILADRLKRLVERGVLTLVPASDGSAFQEYALTERGEALFAVLVALRQFGEAELFERGEPRSTLIDVESGKPVPVLALRRRDGRNIKASETRVDKPEAARRMSKRGNGR